MSRWLKNVNALLENLDNQVEETVDEHRFNRTLSEAVKKGGDDEGNVVEGLLQKEALNVDDILAKRGLLDSSKEEVDIEEDDEGINFDNDTATPDDVNTEEADLMSANIDNVDEKPEELKPDKEVDNKEKEVPVVEEESTKVVDINAKADDSEQKSGLFEDAHIVVQAESKEKDAPTQPKETAPTSSSDKVVTNIITSKATKQLKQQAPSSVSSLTAAPPSKSNDAASIKELRKLRRNVLQLNSDLESAEREIEAQRQELDRAATRMERDRSRHKQEKESTGASHKAELAALAASHERVIQQLKETNEKAIEEMGGRVKRAEQERAKEGGERDAELVDALDRERASVASMARLQDENTTLNERITSLNANVLRLETRLENATSQMEIASERERSAEEQLDKSLTLHAKQLGVRQMRESKLEQTVAELGAALVVAKNKVETAMKAGINLDGDVKFGRPNNNLNLEDPEDIKAHLQDAQDEIETLNAQLSLEQQRCSTLHDELQDLSKEQADELAIAHAKQREYERKITDLTTKVQSSARHTDGILVDVDDEQTSGDEKKETDHLRKQIASLSEKVVEQQSRIDQTRGTTSTLKNRLRLSILRAETAEKSLETANQRLMMAEAPISSELSSADEEMGIKRPIRRGFKKASKVESISSCLGLHPGRFPSGGWQEMAASLLDTFDNLAVDIGSHFRHYPVSRLAYMLYMLILHLWTFVLLVYHTHAQTGIEGGHYGPEAMFHSYRHMEQASKVAGAVHSSFTP